MDPMEAAVNGVHMPKQGIVCGIVPLDIKPQ
jgi:hypothetical protein